MNGPLVFVDLETTGLNPLVHQVWEIAYAVDAEPIRAGFVQHSTVSADPEALRIGGYHQRYNGSLWNERVVEEEMREVLAGATLVAANPAFDAAFLSQRWGCWGSAPWRYRLLDVEAYAAGVFQWREPRGLAAICTELGVEPGDHTAYHDVRALRECYYRLRRLGRSAV